MNPDPQTQEDMRAIRSRSVDYLLAGTLLFGAAALGSAATYIVMRSPEIAAQQQVQYSSPQTQCPPCPRQHYDTPKEQVQKPISTPQTRVKKRRRAKKKQASRKKSSRPKRKPVKPKQKSFSQLGYLERLEWMIDNKMNVSGSRYVIKDGNSSSSDIYKEETFLEGTPRLFVSVDVHDNRDTGNTDTYLRTRVAPARLTYFMSRGPGGFSCTIGGRMQNYKSVGGKNLAGTQLAKCKQLEARLHRYIGGK